MTSNKVIGRCGLPAGHFQTNGALLLKILQRLGFGHEVDCDFFQPARGGQMRTSPRKSSARLGEVAKILDDFRNHERRGTKL
jgi:hypothetical protein